MMMINSAFIYALVPNKSSLMHPQIPNELIIIKSFVLYVNYDLNKLEYRCNNYC